MAFFTMEFESKCLKRKTNVNIILPDNISNENNEYKILYLLHGLKRYYESWVKNTSIERYAKRFGIAVVMPDAERSWYADTQCVAEYFTYVAEEFPETYVWCGIDDNPYLFETNKVLHRLFEELDIKHYYEESEGKHTWKWWDLHIEEALEWMFGEQSCN